MPTRKDLNNLQSSGDFPTLLTITQTAKILNISSSTLRGLIQARKLPFYKIGGSVRFSKEELIEHIKKARRMSRDEY